MFYFDLELVGVNALIRKGRPFWGSVRELIPPAEFSPLRGRRYCPAVCSAVDGNGLTMVILAWLLFLIDLFYNQSQYVVFCRRVLLAVVEDIRRDVFL